MKISSFSMGVALATLLMVGTMICPSGVSAHCDTLDGPVVQTAREALENGDVTPLLKWVRAEDEDEIRSAFDKTLAVRVKGPDARELADMYFLRHWCVFTGPVKGPRTRGSSRGKR